METSGLRIEKEKAAETHISVSHPQNLAQIHEEILGLLDSFFASDQRLINQITKALEESVLVVWEMLGKDEHDEFFCRINQA
jgi:hypothetical protein